METHLIPRNKASMHEHSCMPTTIVRSSGHSTTHALDACSSPTTQTQSVRAAHRERSYVTYRCSPLQLPAAMPMPHSTCIMCTHVRNATWHTPAKLTNRRAPACIMSQTRHGCFELPSPQLHPSYCMCLELPSTCTQPCHVPNHHLQQDTGS